MAHLRPRHIIPSSIMASCRCCCGRAGQHHGLGGSRPRAHWAVSDPQFASGLVFEHQVAGETNNLSCWQPGVIRL